MLGGSVRKNYVEKLEECAITIEVLKVCKKSEGVRGVK